MNPDVQRLEAERLHPMPPEPDIDGTWQQLIGVLARLLTNPPPPDRERRPPS